MFNLNFESGVIAFLVLSSLFLAAFFGLLGRRLGEAFVARTMFSVVFLQFAAVMFSVGLALTASETQATVLHFGSLFHWNDYHFDVVAVWDRLALLWAGMTSFFGLLVVRFSRRYLHREDGYSRFFATLSLFLAGLYILGFANRLDLFFAGWEMVGLSSFLLIGFYRQRLLPARSAMIAFSVYRICDLGLLLAIWYGHRILANGVEFTGLSESWALAVSTGATAHAGFTLSVLILWAALGKSAQFPFSYWLPRAMEGPTPSSAIFYGALSVHAGVLLLARTEALWIDLPEARIAMAAIGLISALLASGAGRVQTNMKGQIAYAAVAQVGLIFIELAMGWKTLALVHMTAHALLRCYQILVSPSAMAHLLQAYSSQDPISRMRLTPFEAFLPRKMQSSLYVFALRESYLPDLWLNGVFRPLERGGAQVAQARVWGLLAVLGVAGLLSWRFGPSAGCIVLAFGLSMFALSSRDSAFRSWMLLGLSSGVGTLAVPLLTGDGMSWLFYGGTWAVGMLLSWVAWSGLSTTHVLDWRSYHLRSEGEGKARIGLLLASLLAWVSFPATPAFLGIDLLLHQVPEHAAMLAPVLGVLLAWNGIQLMRVFVHSAWGMQRG